MAEPSIIEETSSNAADGTGPARNIDRKAYLASLYAYFGKFGYSIISFPITFLLIKHLTPGDFGAYNLFLSMIFFSSILTNLGTLGVIQRYLPEFLQKNEIANVRRTIKLGALLRLAGGIVCVWILLSFTESIFTLLDLPETYTGYALLVGLLLLTTVEAQLFGDGVLGAALDHKTLTFGRLASNLLMLAGVVAVFHYGLGLREVVGVRLASSICLLSFYVFRVYTTMFRGDAISDDRLPYQRMAKYGGFYLMNVFGTFLFDVAIDNFIISHYLGASAVGKYTFAVFVVSLVAFFFPIRMLTPILVNLAIRRFSESGRIAVLSKMFTTMSKLICFGILPATIGVYLLSDEIIVLVFNQKYDVASSVIGTMLFFSLFRYFNYAFQILVKPLEILHISLFQYICSGANLLLDLWLVPKIGILGAALATGSSIALNYLLVYALVSRHASVKQDWKGLARILVNILVMVAVVVTSKPWISGIGGLFLVVAGGAAAYGICSFSNKAFEDPERDLINKTIGRTIFVF